MNALKIGMEKSGFQGREDTPKLIEALEGLEMKEGDDFPQGDKTLRKEDIRPSFASSSSRSGTASTGSSRSFRRKRRCSRRPVSSPDQLAGLARSASPVGVGEGSDPPCRGPDRPLRRPDRAERRQLRSPARRDPRDHRTERGRKEHLLQLPDGRPAPHLGTHPVQRRGHHRAASRPDLPKGIARSYQITNILPNATTLENVRIAAQSRRHRWRLLTHHRAYRDIIDRPKRSWRRSACTARGTSWRPTSPTASSAISRSASRWRPSRTLCLDEPTRA